MSSFATLVALHAAVEGWTSSALPHSRQGKAHTNAATSNYPTICKTLHSNKKHLMVHVAVKVSNISKNLKENINIT